MKLLGECIFFMMLVMFCEAASSTSFLAATSLGIRDLYFYSSCLFLMKVLVMILLISLKFCKTVSLGFSALCGMNWFILLYEFKGTDAPLVTSNVSLGVGLDLKNLLSLCML